MPVLVYDFETRSAASLKSGPIKYASDPSTEVLCCAFAVDDGPIRTWVPTDPIPHEFVEAARDPEWVYAAFNAAFELAIVQHVLAPRLGWPLIPVSRRRCLARPPRSPTRSSPLWTALQRRWGWPSKGMLRAGKTC